MEAAEALVVSGHLALALQDVYLNGGLIVRGGGENLALLGRNGGVAVDKLGEHTAQGLNAEGQRGVTSRSRMPSTSPPSTPPLDGRANGDAFVRVDALEALVSGELLDGVLDSRDTGGAADEQYLAEVAGLEAGVAQGLAHRAGGLFNQVVGQLVELGAG